MPITPFAIFLIAIYIYAALKKNNKGFLVFAITTTVAVTLNVKMGYFVRIGTFEMNYSSVLSYFLGLISLVVIVKKRGKVKTRFTRWYVIFMIMLFIGFIALAIFPYSKAVITGGWSNIIYAGRGSYSYINTSSVQVGYYLMFIFYGISLIVLKEYVKSNVQITILRNVIRISRISVVIGYIEWVCVNLFRSKIITNICIAVFGTSGAQQNELTRRGLLYTVQGATKEPSMFATTIFYLIIISMIDIYIKPEKKKKVWLILACVLLLINPAMSSYVYIVLILAIAFTLGLLKRKKIGSLKSDLRVLSVVSVTIIIFVLLWSNYKSFIQSSNHILNRIGIAIQQLHVLLEGAEYASYSSEGIRFTGMAYDLNLLLERPLLGFGLGSLSCNSGIITLLVNTGIIGFIAWLMMMIGFCNTKMNNRKELLFVIEILILPNIILNDYETILCLVIPLAAICYSNANAIRGRFCLTVEGANI